MPLPDLAFENAAGDRGYRCVAGVDEVGRGPLAGPVVAAAVILGPDAPEGLNDSKVLKPTWREVLASQIVATCAVSIASVSSAELDAINVRQASLLAMARAVRGLPFPADYLLVDGNDMPKGLPACGETIVKGDGHSRSIAAASIVAKVFRDGMMVRADDLWPGYGFERHKGYGTASHRGAIEANGPCPLHRLTFAPLRARK